jgi:hypothetical protein
LKYYKCSAVTNKVWRKSRAASGGERAISFEKEIFWQKNLFFKTYRSLKVFPFPHTLFVAAVINLKESTTANGGFETLHSLYIIENQYFIG